MRRNLTTVLGPVRTPDGVLTMRRPRLRDAPAWSQARLANRQWLERAFPAWGDDWAAEQSEAAWVERWWRLRRDALLGRAKPFVLLLDGRLIGELGVDAVDELSGGGEASVWMVRDHGSAGVMNAASLLMLDHAFAGRHPIGRMVSPVATTSRAGRSPGLRAVGFEIEATVVRRVGGKGYVDHDIWIVHNTAEDRRRIASLLDVLPKADPPPPALPTRYEGVRIVRAATRAAVRSVLNAVRARRRRGRPGPDWPTNTTSTKSVQLRPSSTHAGAPTFDIVHDGTVSGSVRVADDPGTGVVEISAEARDAAGPDVLGPALELVLAAVDGGRFHGTHAAVRVPLDAPAGTVPDDAMLSQLGLTRTATFGSRPGRGPGWGGEHRYEAPSQPRPDGREIAADLD